MNVRARAHPLPSDLAAVSLAASVCPSSKRRIATTCSRAPRTPASGEREAAVALDDGPQPEVQLGSKPTAEPHLLLAHVSSRAAVP